MLLLSNSANDNLPNKNLHITGDKDDDEPWAEVAKFNKLLDIKIKLDEATELKRKANMQKAYLDQQVQLKANLSKEAEKEKTLQHKRIQNLIDEVARDKVDLKNKESLKRMQEKAQRLNALQREKDRKNQCTEFERVERE